MISVWLSLHNLDSVRLWALNDHELLAHLYIDSDPRLKFLYKSYVERILPSTGLVFRLGNKEVGERLAGKKIKVIGEDQRFFDRIVAHASPTSLSAIEDEIADLLDVPPHTVLVVPTLSAWRFVPEDISYNDEEKIFSLRNTQPEYFESLRSELDGYLAVRVSIVGDRSLVHDNAAKIHQLIKRHISESPAEVENLKLTF